MFDFVELQILKTFSFFFFPFCSFAFVILDPPGSQIHSQPWKWNLRGLIKQLSNLSIHEYHRYDIYLLISRLNGN